MKNNNPLTALPPAVRKYVYALLLLAALVLAAWQAAEGDWAQFAVFLLGSLGFGTAASNVNPAVEYDEDEGKVEEHRPDSLGSDQ